MNLKDKLGDIKQRLLSKVKDAVNIKRNSLFEEEDEKKKWEQIFKDLDGKIKKCDSEGTSCFKLVKKELSEILSDEKDFVWSSVANDYVAYRNDKKSMEDAIKEIIKYTNK